MLSLIPRRAFKVLAKQKGSKNALYCARNVTSITANNKSLQTDSRRKELLELRHSFREFLPDPNVGMRNLVREKLERSDMIARRHHIDIPEFYVGSILVVEASDKHTVGKTQRFVGICIYRGGCGLRANFILRNVIDHQGVEIKYELYDPLMQKIDVLRLEKRLDEELFYLRDALPEYSTFDPNMQHEILPEDSKVPINPIKVQLKPRPWLERWERKKLKGVLDLGLPEKFYKRAAELETPWEKYDLMKEYRRTVPEEEMTEILTEVQSKLHTSDMQRKRMKRKRVFVRPTKLA